MTSKTVTRYNMHYVERIDKHKKGEWVRYEDIKHLLAVETAAPSSNPSIVPLREEARIEAALRYDDSEYQLAFAEGYERAMILAARRANRRTDETSDPPVLRSGRVCNCRPYPRWAEECSKCCFESSPEKVAAPSVAGPAPTAPSAEGAGSAAVGAAPDVKAPLAAELRGAASFHEADANLSALLRWAATEMDRRDEALEMLRGSLNAVRGRAVETAAPSSKDVLAEIQAECRRKLHLDARKHGEAVALARWIIAKIGPAHETSADAEDAARYRWLKANHLQAGPDSWIRTGDDLEEAIDAAMQSEKAAACPFGCDDACECCCSKREAGRCLCSCHEKRTDGNGWPLPT